MNEAPAPAAVAPAPGWYRLTQGAQSRPQVGYWDGAAWTGAQRLSGVGGRGPRDVPGRVALTLLCSGLVSILVYVFAGSLFVGTYTYTLGDAYPPAWVGIVFAILILAAPPVAVIASIAGLVRGHQLKFMAPLSLISLILSILGTVLFVLPLALLFTGVWVIRF